jgi:two-component system chemotaxis sensor kinase CheA
VSGNFLDRVAATFRDEAKERLAELESSLLALENAPNDAELVARAFRALHTLKGNGRMFGFDAMATFVHEIETIFDHVRKGQLAVSHELIGITLNSLDLIASMVEGQSVDPALRERLTSEFHAMLPAAGAAPIPAAAPALPAPEVTQVAPPEPPAEEATPSLTYRIRFEPNPELFRDGTNPVGIIEELGDLGTCVATVDLSRVPTLEELDPEACFVAWDIELTTPKEEVAVRDPFMFVEDYSKLRIERVEAAPEPSSPASPRPSPLPITGTETCTPEAPKQPAKQTEAKPAAPAGPPPAAPKTPEAAHAQRMPSAQTEAAASVRVAASKLDQLVDLVGELVTSQARLAQAANVRNDEELRSIAENLERLSNELRDNTLDMRMVPIGTTFGKFMRLVRDLSSELGKEIELVTEGAETELDKTVIERIGDPLVHLIRNCCDHGVESPATREANGKPRRGTVRLSARHSGDSVIIDVADDGAGLNYERIRAKGIERGLISPDDKLTESEVFNLIFLPGFSTAKTISDVSGRGVGMDVVKRSVEALRGSVDIESRLGLGTTIRLRLPLTLAIIEGLLVAVGDSSYVLPMSSIEACVELTGEDIEQAHGNHLVDVRGELVPYVCLRDWFGIEGRRANVEQITIASINGQRVGFVVDQVIGQHQTVLKRLGKMFRTAQEFSGATILGDGHVALVIDVNALFKNVSKRLDARNDLSLLGGSGAGFESSRPAWGHQPV